MTDPIDSGAAEPRVPDAAAPAPAARPTAGRWRPLLVLVLLLGFIVVVVFTVKDNGAVNDLKVGDCFDIPTAASVATVTHHPCTEPHTAEVFLVADYTGSPMDTPLILLIDAFVTSACDPAITTYVGKPLADSPELQVGYLYPSAAAWQSGSRSITCYVVKADQSAMTTSLKGSGGP